LIRCRYAADDAAFASCADYCRHIIADDAIFAPLALSVRLREMLPATPFLRH